MKFKKNILRILLFTTSINIVLQIFTRFITGFASQYVKYIYPLFVNTIGRFTGIFPFSVVEILLFLGIFLFLFFLIRFFYLAIRKKQLFLQLLISGILYLATVISILLLIYTLTCGINYHRESFAQINDLSIEDYTIEDLVKVCSLLTEQVNAAGSKIERNEDGTAIISDNINDRAVSAIKNLASTYPELKGYYPPPKPTITNLLSHLQISGIYSPFTLEANYNKHITPYNIPFTVCHELAHLRGFMLEEEANFIAYLACISSADIEFEYSGSLLAWIYATNALYDISPSRYNNIYSQLDEEVITDLRENSRFWQEYDTVVAEISTKVNDSYLKVNSQSDGIHSYGRMVDLLVAYYLR
jgi:hypothetical protein